MLTLKEPVCLFMSYSFLLVWGGGLDGILTDVKHIFLFYELFDFGKWI